MSFFEDDLSLTRDLIPIQIEAVLSLCISKYSLIVLCFGISFHISN